MPWTRLKTRKRSQALRAKPCLRALILELLAI